MDRRSFFKFAGTLVGGLAIEQAIPLGRVWSFPTQIVAPKIAPSDGLSIRMVREWNISSATLRVDALYGFATIKPNCVLIEN